jgi:hypothetical protein
MVNIKVSSSETRVQIDQIELSKNIVDIFALGKSRST